MMQNIYQNNYLDQIEKKILSPAQIEQWREQITKQSNKPSIIFTNGVFDILHRGHIAYLAEARALGDLLVVALNSDESVRQLKGPDRPVHTLADRLLLMASLSIVDIVTFFDETRPLEIIKKVVPDIHVKGGDYKAEDLPETPLVKKLGGQIKIISFVDGYSSSRIIAKIRG